MPMAESSLLALIIRGGQWAALTNRAEGEFRYLLNLQGVAMRAEVERKYCEMAELVTALGHDGKKYRRETVREMRLIVSEAYSAPRVIETARRFPRLCILPGTALDLTVNDENGECVCM